MLNCTCRLLVGHLTGPSGPGGMEKGRFLCWRMWCVFPISSQEISPHNLSSFAYPFWPNKFGDPLLIPLNHRPQFLSLQRFSSCFFLVHMSILNQSFIKLLSAYKTTLFDPENHLEHHLSLLSSHNLLLQTSFCLNPPASLLFHPRLSTALPHCSMVRNPKCWSPGSDGCSKLHPWPPHLC